MFYVIKEQGNLFALRCLGFFCDEAVALQLSKKGSINKMIAQVIADETFTCSWWQKKKHWRLSRTACSALKRTDNHPHHCIYKEGKNVDADWRKWIKWDVLLCFDKVFFGCYLIFHQTSIQCFTLSPEISLNPNMNISELPAKND